ncbi:hypothetical protein AMTR_s00090p00118750 [Amborella trichopoda]|uniref:14-3-3 domain-containing protein n=1 Tax=Amborella trichopoda TaxID=13333 RepID=W1P266_AMBTC|nr:hypothetical protein AMTR_s00090p00118750 [Amborella trichopoda]
MEAEAEKRKNLLSKAKAAMESECYDQMVHFMKEAVESIKNGLNEEERRLLWTAYLKSMDARLASWQNEMSRSHVEVDPQQLEAVKHKLYTIESEIVSMCSEFHVLIDKHFIVDDNSVEEDVIAYLLKGDLDRYVAEVRPDDSRKFAAACEAHLSYLVATTIANEPGTDVSDSTRRWLDKNFSILKTEFFSTEVAKKDFREYILKWCETEMEVYEGNERELYNLQKSKIKRKLYRAMVLKAILDEDVLVPVPVPVTVPDSMAELGEMKKEGQPHGHP